MRLLSIKTHQDPKQLLITSSVREALASIIPYRIQNRAGKQWLKEMHRKRNNKTFSRRKRIDISLYSVIETAKEGCMTIQNNLSWIWTDASLY